MSISRREFVKQGGGIALASSGALAFPSIARAAAPEITLRWSNPMQLTHPVNIRGKELADNILRETNGRVELQIFPNGQLGADSDVLSQLRAGGIDVALLGAVITSSLVPASAISGVGFAFKDYAQVWGALDGELGNHVRGQLAKTGLVAMDKMWDNGFRQITTGSKPINALADLKGVKIRVPTAALYTSLFKALGSAPTPVNYTELYSALQTKTVEAQENRLALISTGRLYEVQKYVTYTNHMWDGWHFLFNARSWAKIPKDLQVILARNINQAAELQRADMVKAASVLEEELKAKGMVFNTVDTAPFRQMLKTSGYYDEWKKRFGADSWALLEKSSGSLS